MSPGALFSPALWHANKEEKVMILSGEITLVENAPETVLHPGDAACWKAGDPVAHRLVNHPGQPEQHMLIGTRAPDDRDTYPESVQILHVNRIAGSRRYTTLDAAIAGKP
ncbi:MAG: cupin domain-containing protein [Rhodobacteraceae bacterium]|nr:cupin domain-containing protein [Paracoccaceae bacterium]